MAEVTLRGCQGKEESSEAGILGKLSLEGAMKEV